MFARDPAYELDRFFRDDVPLPVRRDDVVGIFEDHGFYTRSQLPLQVLGIIEVSVVVFACVQDERRLLDRRQARQCRLHQTSVLQDGPARRYRHPGRRGIAIKQRFVDLTTNVRILDTMRRQVRKIEKVGKGSVLHDSEQPGV